MEKESKASRVWQLELSRLAPNTRRRYIRLMDAFLSRFEIDNLEILYNMRIEDLEAKDSRDQGRVERLVKTYMDELVKKGQKPQSVAHSYKAIQHFFNSQGKKTKLEINPRDVPKGESIGRSLITKDKIKLVWDSAGSAKLRNRALMMLLKDTGLRISDALAFNVEAYTTAQTVENESKEPFRIFDPAVTKKCGVVAYVIIGPESIQALDLYLKERCASGKLSPTDPLFVTEVEGGPRHKGERMRPDAGTEELLRLANMANIGKRYGAHSFRKYFITQMQSAGLSEPWIKRLCGKSLGASDSPYSKPQDMPDPEGVFHNLLVASYVKSYKALRVFGASEEVEDLKERTRQLEEKLKGRPYDWQAVVDESNRNKKGAEEQAISIKPSDLQRIIQEEIKKALEQKR